VQLDPFRIERYYARYDFTTAVSRRSA
jgi:hypothetical protein